MFKEFLMKKMLKKQGVPEDQADLMIKLVSKNPNLFKQIAEEVQVEVKKGKDQMAATMEVMTRHKRELEDLNRSI